MNKASDRSYIKFTLLNIALVASIILSLLYIINVPSDSSAIQISDVDIKNYKGFSFRPTPNLNKSIVNLSKNIKLELTFGDNENLPKFLIRAGLDKENASKITNIIQRKYDLKKLSAGQKIILNFENISSSTNDIAPKKNDILVGLKFKADSGRELILKKYNNKFVVSFDLIPLTIKYSKTENVIEKSFFEALSKNSFSGQAIKKLTQAFSYDLDFQRDLKKGDKIELLYEKLYDSEGNFVKTGNIIYASLKLSNGKKYSLFRYQIKDNDSIYLSEDGKDIKKDLLKTPIHTAKVSSKFGMRVHPIHGYSKMHKGVDFSARFGTPVFSAGKGIIVELTSKNGYGKYLKIDHGKNWATAYAHLSKFSPGLKKGDKVSQGQLIGFVGTTGNVTAAHLHYETIYKNVQVNPLNVKFPRTEILSKNEMMKFRQHKKQILSALKSVKTHTEIASNSTNSLFIGKK